MNAPLQLTPAADGLAHEKLLVDVAGLFSACSEGFLDRTEAELPFVAADVAPIVREAIQRERVRRRLMTKPVKRTLEDAVHDAREAIHDRRAKAFGASRLPYPKDEEEIDRG